MHYWTVNGREFFARVVAVRILLSVVTSSSLLTLSTLPLGFTISNSIT
jgi:hypothetical protein